ncbi:MAG: hypothetical protein R3F17_13530 [Planctomycetota bacterium]
MLHGFVEGGVWVFDGAHGGEVFGEGFDLAAEFGLELLEVFLAVHGGEGLREFGVGGDGVGGGAIDGVRTFGAGGEEQGDEQEERGGAHWGWAGFGLSWALEATSGGSRFRWISVR